MPSMDDVLRKNPELARQMAAAAASQAGPGFGNFMGMAMGVSPQGQAPFGGNGPMGAPMPPQMGQQPQMASTGAFFAASASPAAPQAQERPTARREMSGPTGVEDILRTFEEVRRAETAASAMPQYATGAPAQGTQAAVAVASGSVADDMSQGESVRTGATGQGRRRRRAQAPLGNVMSLNA